MKAREGVRMSIYFLQYSIIFQIMSSREYGESIHKLYPVVENEMTDSGCFIGNHL